MLRLLPNDETRIVYKPSLHTDSVYCLQVMKGKDELHFNGMRVKLMPADANVSYIQLSDYSFPTSILLLRYYVSLPPLDSDYFPTFPNISISLSHPHTQKPSLSLFPSPSPPSPSSSSTMSLNYGH